MLELGSISARVLINQSVKACELGKLLLLRVMHSIQPHGIDHIIPKNSSFTNFITISSKKSPTLPKEHQDKEGQPVAAGTLSPTELEENILTILSNRARKKIF